MSLDQVLSEILSLRAEVLSLKAIINKNGGSSNASVVSTSSSSTKPGKETKKKRNVAKDENGKPKLTKWTAFTKRVADIMKEENKANGPGAIFFAKSLKDKRTDYENLSTEEIKEELKGFVAPEVKKGGRKSNKQATPAAHISSPGDEEQTNNIVSNVSVPSSSNKVELDFGGDDDEETNEEEISELENIVYKGKKYMYNISNGHCYHRDPATDKQLGWAGIFNPKDPKTGKPSLDTSASEPQE